MSNVIYKQTDRQTFTAKNTTSFILICLYSLKLNDNKHSWICKVTHTHDFHGLQPVHKWKQKTNKKKKAATKMVIETEGKMGLMISAIALNHV